MRVQFAFIRKSIFFYWKYQVNVSFSQIDRHFVSTSANDAVVHFEVAEKNSGLFAESRDVFKESPRLSEEDCGLLRESDTLPSEKGGRSDEKEGKKQKWLALFAWKKRASREKERQRRKTLPRRPTGEDRGAQKLENKRREGLRSTAQKGISAPLSPLRLPNARHRYRAPRSYRRRQPAAFPAHSARPICGRGDFRIRAAHKWH